MSQKLNEEFDTLVSAFAEAVTKLAVREAVAALSDKKPENREVQAMHEPGKADTASSAVHTRIASDAKKEAKRTAKRVVAKAKKSVKRLAKDVKKKSAKRVSAIDGKKRKAKK